MEYKGFIGGSYPAQAVTLDQERTINLYVERSESPGASARSALYPTPGVSLLTGDSSAGGRAHFAQNDREFCVIGRSFKEVNQSGLLISIGNITQSGLPATISSNGDGGGQLFITSGGQGWLYTLATGVLASIAALADKADMGDHLDGYFLALDQSSSTFFVSQLLDGATWNTGTSFAQRSGAPDPWVALKVLGQFVWLLGEQTSEVWFNAAGAFPFELHPSGRIPYGCAAPHSVAVGDGAIYWLGGTKLGTAFVLRSTGFAPEIISQAPMELRISEYARIDDAFGECYSDLGHTFYVLSFPQQGATWVYDARSGQWHERGTWIEEAASYTSWRPRHHAFAFGQHRMLDATSGGVYRMSRDIGVDVQDTGFTSGRVIRRLRRAPALQNENERVYYSGFELDLEPGLGAVTGQGEDPQVAMRYSNDGGKTWSPELWRSAGALGDYGRRVRWDRLGSARRRAYEIVMSDPVPWRITNAYLRLGQPVGGAR